MAFKVNIFSAVVAIVVVPRAAANIVPAPPPVVTGAIVVVIAVATVATATVVAPAAAVVVVGVIVAAAANVGAAAVACTVAALIPTGANVTPRSFAQPAPTPSLSSSSVRMMSRSQCCLHTARDLEELSEVGAAWRAAAGNEVTFIGLRERSASEVKRVKREGGGIRLSSGLGTSVSQSEMEGSFSSL